MSCEQVRRLLAVYGELDRPERRAVTQHLRGCPACRAQWAEELQVRALLHQVPVLSPPRGFEERLLAIPASPSAGAGPRALPWLAAAGAALLVGLGTMVVQPPAPVSPGGGTAPTPPAAATVVSRLSAPAPRLAPPPTAQPAPAEPPVVAGARVSARPAPGAGRAYLGLAPVVGVDPTRSADQPVRGGEPAGDTGGDGRGARARPTAPAPTPTAPACVQVTLVAFADLAGVGSLEGPGCDGAWTEDVAVVAASASLALPPLLVSAYDPAQDWLTQIERWIEGDGARVELALPDCLHPGWRLRLRDPAGIWNPCPAVGATDRTVPDQGPATVGFPLTMGCPLPGPTPSSTPVGTAPVSGTATPADSPAPVAPATPSP